jgi:hypothetical protein
MCQAYVRERCGLPAWEPTKRKPRAPKAKVPFPVRNMFLGEDLRIIRHRRRISLGQFALLLNDLKLRGGDTEQACRYARRFGLILSREDIERAMQAAPKHTTPPMSGPRFSKSPMPSGCNSGCAAPAALTSTSKGVSGPDVTAITPSAG